MECEPAGQTTVTTEILFFFSQRLDLLAIKQQCLACFDRKDINSRRGANLQSPFSNARNVPAHVVVLLGYFHGDGAAIFPGQLAAAQQAFIGGS